jgi:methionyl-tRNA formyltransferase
MRIYIVIDEESFYHPRFLNKFLKNTEDSVVGCALVTKVPAKHNIETYLKTNWYFLKITEIIKLAYLKYRSKVLDSFGFHSKDRFYSVKSVLKFFQINFIEVQNSINQKKYLDVIRKAKPDVIVSSNFLIFGEELLKIPSICCINRHSSLLPSYGGLWPVFQAYRAGEAFTGASVHIMGKKIDQGIVLTFRKIPIEKGISLASLYEHAFDISADILIEALDKIRSGDWSSQDEGRIPSYYSFPRKEHWKQFRERGGRFI